MVFTDPGFWLFLGIVLLFYILLPHRGQNRMLLVASYFFYGMWDWRFLSLLAISTIVDFFVARLIDNQEDGRKRKAFLFISIATNLGILGFFKYFNFFVGSFAALLERFNIHTDITLLSIILPVGISFYTFQTLSYTIDVYRRRIRPATNILDFALFVSFFPQLVAGPIERASNLLPMVIGPRQMSWENVARGSVLSLVGLIKKVVIADGIGTSVNAVFANPNPSQIDVLLATWLFAVQIYCDFSGYTDIARGVAKMMGFDLMRNFAQPYFAANPQEFWRRWHISLSSWLRDYLYISLGGNRKGNIKTYRNLMATMLLGGLWHGAAWNFVLWGGYQGLLLSAHRFIAGRRAGSGEGEKRSPMQLLVRVVGIAAFFQLVCYGWLLFRARSFHQIADFTGRLMGVVTAPHGLSMPIPPAFSLLGIAMLFTYDLAIEWTGDSRFYLKSPTWLRAGFYASAIYFLALGMTTTPSTFIYFQF